MKLLDLDCTKIFRHFQKKNITIYICKRTSILSILNSNISHPVSVFFFLVFNCIFFAFTATDNRMQLADIPVEKILNIFQNTTSFCTIKQTCMLTCTYIVIFNYTCNGFVEYGNCRRHYISCCNFFYPIHALIHVDTNSKGSNSQLDCTQINI